jgi:methanogenic corrinoid protein MtbC1
MSVFVEQVPDSGEWRGNTSGAECVQTRQSFDTAADFSVFMDETLPRARRASLLDRIVKSEVLPRLAMAARAAASRSDGHNAVVMTTNVDTGTLVQLLLTSDTEAAVAFIDGLRLRGVTPEDLYKGVLPAAAREIGVMWDEDRCDFTQVTIGVGRLQQIARMLSPRFQDSAAGHVDGSSILLMPVTGEQHTFGLTLLAEFFQRAGWRVSGGPVTEGVDPSTLVRNAWYDVAGFSLGSESLIAVLTKSIRQVRRASRNRCLVIMVGGPLFLLHPDLVAQVGADTTANDAPDAVRQAGALLTSRAATD